ncbi:hypothetical protein UY3_09485 [Chelonia mydas]|uniref:Uncharacterized protein n=1 Tax=Chelonia mydas TaxID=8469 RepID=M7B619_CHEMY|nr:hypothetical protein UY3_09485 [Chelonia mydas]
MEEAFPVRTAEVSSLKRYSNAAGPAQLCCCSVIRTAEESSLKRYSSAAGPAQLCCCSVSPEWHRYLGLPPVSLFEDPAFDLISDAFGSF